MEPSPAEPTPLAPAAPLNYGTPALADPRADAGRLREVALLFTRLGFTAFGGPAAHTAMMEDEVVRRRKWLDRQHFLDLVGALNFIPGPNSTELAIHLGYLRAGLRGLVVAGVCFIVPAVLIILPLAWAYVRYGDRPDLPAVQGALRGISGTIVAIVAVAGWRFGQTALKDRFTVALAVVVLLAAPALWRWAPGVQPELVLLAAAAVAGVAWYVRGAGSGAGGGAVPLLGLPLAGGTAATTVAAATGATASAWAGVGQLAWFFLKVGGTLFGSGYVLVSYLQSGLVDRPDPWLTQQQLLDAVAVGQVTPGPLLTTATFIGYLRGHALFGTTGGGVLGGVVATAAIFLPSFLLVAAFAGVLPRARANRIARAALDGINAAVVALIAVVVLQLLWKMQAGGRPDWLRLGIAAASLLLLLRTTVNSTWLILAAAAAGAGVQLLARG